MDFSRCIFGRSVIVGVPADERGRANLTSRVRMKSTSLQTIPLELKLTKLALLGTLLVTVGFFGEVFPILRAGLANHALRATIECITYITFVCFLICGNTLYLLSRIGYFRRLAAHRPATDEELRGFYNATAPAVTFLIPSYK